MKIQVEGRTIEVDDSFGSLSPEQQQAEVESIAKSLRPQESPVSAEPVDEINPLYGMGAGAGAGVLLGPVISAGSEAIQSRNKAVNDIILEHTGGSKASAGQKWAAKTGFGTGPGETVREVSEEFKKEAAPAGKGKISQKIAGNKPLTIDASKALAEKKAMEEAKFAAIRQAEKAAKLKAAGSAPGKFIEAAVKYPTAPFIGRALAGGATGFDVADAVNRFRTGDYPGAAIAGLGALGGAAAFIPHPATRIGGTAINMLANTANLYRDSQNQPQGHAAGGKAVKGGLEALKKTFTPKPTNIVRASEALGPHEGKYLYVTESDRMRSTGGDLGGPGFSKFQLEDPRYAEAQAAWGVAAKPKASSIVNINKRFPEDKILWSPLIGAENQHRSNQHVYDMLTDEFSRQASMGKLSPELRSVMNQRLSNFPKYAPSKLSGIDVANPEMLKEMGNTFDRRAAISEVLGGKGVGGRKGQIFDYPGIMQEMTDPMTLGAPTHSVGTRLFSLTGDVDHRPDLHSAFPYILKGEDKGVAFNPVPKELALGDWIEQVKDFTGREPGYMEFMRGVKGGHGRPNQFISEEFLRKLQDAGHKKGGLV